MQRLTRSRGAARRQASWRLPFVVVTALFAGPIAVKAQQPEPPSTLIQRVQSALQSPQPSITGEVLLAPPPGKPEGWRVGVLTFLPPEAPGQFVRIGVPIGALASHAVRSVATARHRRSESAARRDVALALAAFRQAQAK
jgi:hypothetical protein